jgi:YidC/Oxa1 family membrane protein insertase
MEMRLLLAFLLMGAVLFLTPYFYKPAPPPKAPEPAEKAVPTPAVAKPKPPPPKPAPAAVPMPGQISGQKEEIFTVETDLYRIEFSNRGAVARSWILKKYHDNNGKPLELVNAKGVEKAGYPLAFAFLNNKPATDPNQTLFAAKPTADSLGIDYEFSDGKTFFRKSFRFRKDSYISQISSEVVQDGSLVPNLLAWRGGFGDSTVPNPSGVEHAVYYDVTDSKLRTENAKAAKEGPVSHRGNYSFAGLEDTYFAAVALPNTGSSFEVVTFSDSVPVGTKEEAYVGAGLGGEGKNEFSLFVGPKDLDLLRRVDPKLSSLIDFGWFAFLAKPLFLVLNWLDDHWFHNYGWAIVFITIAINFLLLPLKFTSLKSMKKMQLLQPQISAINQKYKGISIRDPRKAQQNQEVMELYKKHGVNPMGGCMPMVLQIPFFIAFYKVLSVAIELRGAEWLWVGDLSQPEHLPIRILPVTMIVTQFIMQKMTPSTSPDPSQQKIMMLMPLVLGFMFYGVSSGLVLYWLTSNVVQIVQQWFFNRKFQPAPVEEPRPVARKRGSRK